ncbi:MAG: mucoidy inhibitor MuiA family protein, partial [Variovorax sp.]
MLPLPPFRRAALALPLLIALTAQANNTESRITQVKVYPCSATVERMARVAAGSKTITFNCLPARLDLQSLQVTADASVRLGETAVLTEPRAQSTACGAHALDDRIRELEDQKAALQSETDALSLVTGYLRGIATQGGGGDAAAAIRAAPDAKGVTAMADALRRTGQDSLQKQHQLKRRHAELDKLLAPMLAERTRSQGNGGNVVSVTVTLATTRDADVRLSYQVAGPGWTPAYRAMLDTGTRRLRLERQALVAQSTGEDWRGVKLVLSTGQPRRETTGR